MKIYQCENFLHENFPIYGTKEAYVGGRRGEIERQTETHMQERGEKRGGGRRRKGRRERRREEERGEEREEEGGEGRKGENRQTDRHTVYTCMLMSFAGTSSACDTSTDKLIRFMAVCGEKYCKLSYIGV